MKNRGLLALLLSSAIPALAVSADNLTGRTIGSACFGCHGAAGANETSIPPVIVGVPAQFIVKSLQEFRDGTRSSTIMGRIARGYSDEEIDAVASYVASLARN